MPPRKDWTKITYIRYKHLPTLLHTWPPWAVVCPLPFEVVDAAVARHMPEPSIDVVITRVVHTPVSVCYVLTHDRHGDQGKLWVRSVGLAQTELVAEAPPYPPRRAWTAEEEAFVRAQRDPLDMIHAVDAIDERIDDERDTLYSAILSPHSRSVALFAIRFLRERQRLGDVFTLASEQPHSTPPVAAATEDMHASAQASSERPGHPGLARDEVIYRLAKALEAEVMKERYPTRTWKEISHAVGFDRGESKASEVALLRDARLRLQRLRESTLELDRRLLAEAIEQAKTMNKTR
jgi:hypothetical protein